jgi:hypothetical protein
MGRSKIKNEGNSPYRLAEPLCRAVRIVHVETNTVKPIFVQCMIVTIVR